MHSLIHPASFITGSIQKASSLFLNNSYSYGVTYFEILYNKHLRLIPFTKAPKREKKGFPFWCFIYISTFANINMLNKKSRAELEELW